MSQLWQLKLSNARPRSLLVIFVYFTETKNWWPFVQFSKIDITRKIITQIANAWWMETANKNLRVLSFPWNVDIEIYQRKIITDIITKRKFSVTAESRLIGIYIRTFFINQKNATLSQDLGSSYSNESHSTE